MTADKQGIKMREATIGWLNVATLLLALVGPPATYLIQQQRIEAVYGVRLERAERDITKIEGILDSKIERIDLRLQAIEQGLSRIQGSLRTMNDGPQTSLAGGR